MKKIFSVLLVVSLLFALVACGNNTPGATVAPETSSSAPSKPSSSAPAEPAESKLSVGDLKIGVIMKSFDEFQNQVIDGATDKAVELGVKQENVIALAPKNESDLYGQVQMIENCIAQGVNILLLSAQNPDIVNEPLAKASAAGIKIVMVDTDAPNFKDPNKVTFIGTDNYAAANEGAIAFVTTYMQEGQNAVILRGKLGDTNHDARTKGLEDACKANGINILEVGDANCEPEKAMAMMENFITKYGDKINGLLVTSDNMSVAAIESIKAANKMDKIVVCGFDGFQASIQCVADGTEKMIIAQKPYWMGEEAVKNGIAALLEGETFDEYINPGIAIIDASNYKDYLK
jgi:ribose transport system substrate-binding protein